MKRDVDDDVTEMLERLKKKYSPEELCDIYFTPLILSHIVWKYCDEFCDNAVQNKISDFKKISRELRQLKSKYDHDVIRYLDWEHTKNLFKQVDDFLANNEIQFVRMFWSVNAIVIKKHPHFKYGFAITYAIMFKIYYQILTEHIERLAEWATLNGKRLANVSPLLKSAMKLIDSAINYYPLDLEFKNDNNVIAAKKIFDNLFKTTVFNV